MANLIFDKAQIEATIDKAGTWLLGKSRFLRRNGDAGTDDCLPGICRCVWLHRNLLCGSGCVARRLLLYRTDMSVLREEIHENDCGSRCEIITLFSVLQRLPDTSQVIAAITRNLVHHGFWFIALKNKKKDTVLHGIIFPAKQYLFSCFFQRYRSIPSLAARPLSNGCLIFFSSET